MERRMGRRLVAAAAAMALAAVAGCGGDDEATAGGGGGGDDAVESVQVTAIIDATGMAGFSGKPEVRGLELGIDQLNATGEYDIDLTVEDTGSDQTQAVNLMNKAARSDADLVMFGAISAEALALAPIAQRERVPTIFMQSGVDGVVQAGDHAFRVTTPLKLFFPALFDYLEEQGVKRVGSFYAGDSATVAEIAEDVIPGLAEEHGMELVPLGTVTSTQTDFRSVASKVADAAPDALFQGTQGSSGPTIVSQIRRAGYDGIIFNPSAFACGVLDPLGARADALVWPQWFHADTDLPVGQRFVKDYEAEYGEEPCTFAGEAYDATLLLKEALDHIDGDVTRESLQQALVAATEAGFPATQAEPLTFEERDARGGGFVIRRDDGKDTIVASPTAAE